MDAPVPASPSGPAPADRTPGRAFLVGREGTTDLTHAQTLSSRFVLTSRGVRLPADAADVDRARWEAAHLPLRPESVLSHTTAARIHGLPLPWRLQGTGAVHVTTPRAVPRPRRRDIVTHHAFLPETDVCVVEGLRVTTLARTYVDMAALVPFDHLVALGDVVLRRSSVSPVELLGVARTRSNYPGRRHAVLAVGWLDPAAESPRESHLRVLLRRARLPRPEVNRVITDEHGGFLARADLVFRRQRVIVEYDGEVHASMSQRAKDAARRALLREHGWTVVEIVGEDMRYPHRVVARVRSALSEGARYR
jgi:very-short-patch-repair endonuclease